MSIFGIFPQSHVTDKKLAGSIAFSIAAIKPGSEKLIFLLTILASGGGWASILLLPMLLCTTAIGMHLI